MRHGLDQCQTLLGSANLALEERQETFCGHSGHNQMFKQAAQSSFVILDHLDQTQTLT